MIFMLTLRNEASKGRETSAWPHATVTIIIITALNTSSPGGSITNGQ